MSKPKKKMEIVPLDRVRALIDERAQQIGLDLATASKMIGRNHAYLHQYIRYNVPKSGLKEHDRANLAPILGVKPRDLMSEQVMGSFANRTFVRPMTEAPDFGDPPPLDPDVGMPHSNVRHAPTPPKPDRLNEIPLLGSGQAGPDGVFELNQGVPIDYVARPPGLIGKARIYCIYVDGSSMEPAHMDGDLIFVDAARKPFPGRDAVIELHPEYDGDPLRAFIKRIVKMTPDYIELFEFKPKERSFRLARSKIRNLHLVLKNTDIY